ncbi:glycosyltransferase family 2 protein [Leeuwenhoekiella sp. MAR_2009_132]|uniref:glycosyltransferase family 2 protein n=1 Tax=Leeuwenhoekiella sp. MAR_2009_132 TaxID=1392489 RepID=UPI00048F0494|nr:glycosyltransferase family 2 protein [Leeuwenhoekiella sp. MAR_2009_132]
MTAAILIPTYNWPQALQLVLASLENQTVLPDEVLIADDGSSSETKQIIEDFKKRFEKPVHHFWHEDRGFRKSEILNKALLKCVSDYVIQIDGDCIMHRSFIEDHKRFSAKNTFLYGSRVNIQKGYLKLLFSKKEIDFNFFSKGIKKRTRTLRFPVLCGFYKSSLELSTKTRGCNFSYWRADAMNVNGYDELYTGWGREDSDFAARLLHSGVAGKRIRYAGIVYHIWHQEKSKDNLEINNSYYENVLSEKRILPGVGAVK